MQQNITGRIAMGALIGIGCLLKNYMHAFKNDDTQWRVLNIKNDSTYWKEGAKSNHY